MHKFVKENKKIENAQKSAQYTWNAQKRHTLLQYIMQKNMSLERTPLLQPCYNVTTL